MNVLDASRSKRFYCVLMLSGFALGLSVNLWELQRAIAADFGVMESVAIMSWTYQFGRNRILGD